MSNVAFCFPGQGSQRVGMARDFVAQFPEAAAVFDEASEELDFDLRRVCFEGPIEDLSQTEVTQPALVASSLAAFRSIQERLGVKPDVVVGHSVGEYAAIAAADSVGVGVVTRLSRLRGYLDAELAGVFARFGLTSADFLVIVSLRRGGPPYRMPQARLMDALGLTSGTVSVRLDRLEKSGVVIREPDPASARGPDSRIVAASHTPELSVDGVRPSLEAHGSC